MTVLNHEARSLRTTVVAVGRHRNMPRIYLEGRWLIDAGFEPGDCFEATFAHQRIELHRSATGRSVSSKKQGRVGVIDLHCSQIGDAFETIDRVMMHADPDRLIITAERISAQQAARQLTDTAVSLFSGGGLLSEAVRQAGFRLLGAVEIEPRYADMHQLNHPGRMYACSIEQVDWEQLASMVRTAGPLGLLAMGLPCEPFSRIRRLDRGGQRKRDRQQLPEAHELGDLVYFAIKAADLLNPHTLILEQVPPFLESGASWILRGALHRLGYTVDANIISPLEHGGLMGRPRAVVVATNEPAVHWPQPLKAKRSLGQIFDPVPEDSELWFDATTKPWLYQHWQRQSRRGNGFEPPKLTGDETTCPTIKKRYFAGQGDNPVVQHPSNPEKHRWLTVNEVRRLMGLPEGYQLAETKTTAGEALGQGVHVPTFRQLIESVTNLQTETIDTKQPLTDKQGEPDHD